MTPPPANAEPQERTDWTLAYVLGGAVLLVALMAAATSPVAAILGDSAYAIPGALHGVAAMVFVIVSTIGAYFGYLLYTGRLEAWRGAPAAGGLITSHGAYFELRVLTAVGAVLSAATVVFGNWIYIYYRASSGPRAYFLENNPVIHEIFFEFKEFIALFTVPLSVAAAFIVWHQGEKLRDNAALRQAVAVLLVLTWVYLMITFGLGAAITKLRSV